MYAKWKTVSRCAVLSAALLATSQWASASQLLYDNFNYNAGPLAGNVDSQVTPSVTWALTGPANSGTSVVAGNLTGPTNLPASSGSMDQTSKSLSGADRAPLAATIPDPSATTGTETIYYSTLMKVSSISSYTTTTGSFIAGLNNLTGSSGTTLSTAGGVLCIAAPTTGSTGSNFVLGVGENQAGTGARVFDETNAYTSSDTLFVVVAYTLNPGSNNDVAKLYVYANPGNVDATEPATANATSDAAALSIADVSTAGDGFESFFLRNNGSAPTNINFDEVRVGTTWADVVPTAATPEPAALALVGLTAPLVARRRRRST